MFGCTDRYTESTGLTYATISTFLLDDQPSSPKIEHDDVAVMQANESTVEHPVSMPLGCVGVSCA